MPTTQTPSRLEEPCCTSIDDGAVAEEDVGDVMDADSCDALVAVGEEGEDDDDTLLKVLGRRKQTHAAFRNVDDGYCDYDDEEVRCCSSGRGSIGRAAPVASYEYRCQWKHHDCTWESRRVIEEMGYSRMVTAFDAALHPSNQGLRAVTHPAPPEHAQSVVAGQLMDKLGGLPSLLQWVRRQFTLTKSRVVIRYAETQCMHVERPFYRHWQKIDASYRPELCFVPMEINQLHNVLARGVTENAARIEATFSRNEAETHSALIWCCEVPDMGMDLVDNDLVLVCAALTSESFLPNQAWHTFQRKNGWFPMPKVVDVKKTGPVFLTPLCLVEAKCVGSLSDMERFMVGEPQLMVSPAKLIDAMGDSS